MYFQRLRNLWLPSLFGTHDTYRGLFTKICTVLKFEFRANAATDWNSFWHGSGHDSITPLDYVSWYINLLIVKTKVHELEVDIRSVSGQSMSCSSVSRALLRVRENASESTMSHWLDNIYISRQNRIQGFQTPKFDWSRSAQNPEVIQKVA